MTTSRLFAAIWLPGFVTEAVQRHLQPLREQFGEIRWQPQQRWHLTLAFLGDRDETLERSRFGQVQAPEAGEMAVRGAGTFGPILWLGIHADEWLSDLAGRVQRQCRAGDRRFRPHITIGRGRSTEGRRQVVRARALLADIALPAWTPTEFTIVRSTTGPQPHYEVIARSRLASGA